MLGGRPITLFHVRGIRIAVDWSWFIVLFLMIFWLADFYGRVLDESSSSSTPFALAVVSALAFFVSVLLHELAHSLYAVKTGSEVRGITLLIIGGVSQLVRPPASPRDEAYMALVGPLVSLALGAVLTASSMLVAASSFSARFALFYLGTLNLALGLFNLLPAFPMDGGRIFRALLSIPLGRLPATRAAVFVSIAMAVLFGFIGVLILHNVMLVLIGVFVIWAGQQELVALEMRERQRQEGHLDEAPEVEPQAPPSWHPTPNRPVTVYVWDARTHQWIFQGIVPQT